MTKSPTKLERDAERGFVVILPDPQYPDLASAESLGNAVVARAIANDWKTFFPEFKYWKTRCLVRVVGPVVQIILLERGSGGWNYNPIHLIAFLSSIERNDSFAWRLELCKKSTLKPGNGWLMLHDHHQRLPEFAKEMRERLASLPTEGDWTFDQLLPVAWKLAKKSKGNWPGPLRDVILLCTWAGKIRLAKWYYLKAKTMYYALYWPILLISKVIGGADASDMRFWRQDIHQLIDHPEKVRQLVEDNIIRFKLDKMPRFEVKV